MCRDPCTSHLVASLVQDSLVPDLASGPKIFKMQMAVNIFGTFVSHELDILLVGLQQMYQD